MNVRKYLEENILLFDGGMGTLCAEIIPESIGNPCEKLNITHPDKISEIHRSYITAGSKAIKTNTFGANRKAFGQEECEKIIETGFKIAKNYENVAFVFADIGPISVTDADNLFEEYKFVADSFLSLGAKNFLFETNSTLDGLEEISNYIKAKNSNAFIILSFASLPDGFTRAGKSVAELLSEACKFDSVDAVGLNCASGARHLAKLVTELPKLSKPLSVMPNAGYPTVLGNRTFYDGDPTYFGRQIGSMVPNGVKIFGGCCGTTPKHIEEAYRAILTPQESKAVSNITLRKSKALKDDFWNDLCDSEKRPIAVELDPPENADINRFMAGAAELKSSGADVITIADCPIARARMDSSILACKLHRELDIGVLPHLTCRDRNLNAIKALLLGLCAEGVHNVLTVTGDPIPSADLGEVKSVYNFNSRMLAGYIKTLGEKELPVPFRVFGALNVNARNFNIQLKMAMEKEEKGICGFLTQPILTEQAVENLKLARKNLKGKILGGIFPIVSHRNACFMNSEVAGVKVDEKITALYIAANREKGEDLAVKISTEIAKIIRPFVDGYYLMTPFSRTELIGKIIDNIR